MRELLNRCSSWRATGNQDIHNSWQRHGEVEHLHFDRALNDLAILEQRSTPNNVATDLDEQIAKRQIKPLTAF